MERETWKALMGQYEISDLGRIRNKNTLRLKSLRRLNSGYLAVTLCVQSHLHYRTLHAAVLEAFVGPRPDGHYGCHLNGDRSDNRLVNLVWATPTENAAHKFQHGRHVYGEAHKMSRLTERDVRMIRSCATSSESLGAALGVSGSLVRRIRRRQAWPHCA